jgi:hypothetical protein
MSRKHGRKHHHNQPNKNKPSGVQGRTPLDTLAVNADAPHGEAIQEASNKNEEPTKMPKRLDLMTVFTGVLALFAILSLGALWIQLRDARENFINDQRPWVWVEFPAPFHLKVGDLATLNVQFFNYGKTPAIAKHVVFLFAAIAPTPQIIKNFQQFPVSPYSDIIPPGGTKFTWSTASGHEVVDQKMYDMIMSGKATVIAGGRIIYTDLGGNTYDSAFCYMPQNSGAIVNCPAPELNYMK